MISKFAKILDTTIVAVTSSCILWLVKELLRLQIIRVQCNFTTFYSLHIKSSYLLVQKKTVKCWVKTWLRHLDRLHFRILNLVPHIPLGLGFSLLLRLVSVVSAIMISCHWIQNTIWRSIWYKGDTRHRWRFSLRTSSMYATLYYKTVFPLAKFWRRKRQWQLQLYLPWPVEMIHTMSHLPRWPRQVRKASDNH